MIQVPNNKLANKRLIVAGELVAFLVVGFFVYKYTYIYVERRKYNQAEVAINKVAADLRAQGIETTFSKGCGRAQEVFGPGALSCSVGITYSGVPESDDKISKFIEFIPLNGFMILNDTIIMADSTVSGGPNVYSFTPNNLQCNLLYSPSSNDSKNIAIKFYCVDNSRFKLF